MVAKPLCPLYKNIIKPLDRARYPELRYILATELNIQHTWKVFGIFWDMDAESLRGGFNKAKDHAYKYHFDEEIMDILR